MKNKILAVLLWVSYGLAAVGGMLGYESDAYYMIVGLLMLIFAIWAGIALWKSKVDLSPSSGDTHIRPTTGNYCVSCGISMPETAKFCTGCGNKKN